MSNEVTVKIDVSDELLEKVIGAMIRLNSAQSMGALPMMLGGMLAPPTAPPSEQEKIPMGFRAPSEKGEK